MNQLNLLDQQPEITNQCPHCGHHGTLENENYNFRMKISVLCDVMEEGIADPSDTWKSRAREWIDRMRNALRRDRYADTHPYKAPDSG